MDQEPYTFESPVRMLNYPIRGPGEGVVSKETITDLDGAFLRCCECACLNAYTCPTHHCILSVDRMKSGSFIVNEYCIEILYCRDCDYTINIDGLTCDHCHRPSSCFQYYW